MKPLKSKVSITLDSDMIAQLKELALKEYLNQKNKEA